MGGSSIVEVWLLLAVCCGLVCAWLAYRKGRSPAWFAAGAALLFMGPVLVAGLPQITRGTHRRRSANPSEALELAREIGRLGALRDSGALTEAAYTARKRRLLQLGPAAQDVNAVNA